MFDPGKYLSARSLRDLAAGMFANRATGPGRPGLRLSNGTHIDQQENWFPARVTAVMDGYTEDEPKLYSLVEVEHDGDGVVDDEIDGQIIDLEYNPAYCLNECLGTIYVDDIVLARRSRRLGFAFEFFWLGTCYQPCQRVFCGTEVTGWTGQITLPTGGAGCLYPFVFAGSDLYMPAVGPLDGGFSTTNVFRVSDDSQVPAYAIAFALACDNDAWFMNLRVISGSNPTDPYVLFTGLIEETCDPDTGELVMIEGALVTAGGCTTTVTLFPV